MRFTLGILLLMGTIGFLPGQRGAAPSGAPAPTYSYEVVRSYPHDRNAFTQGLIFRDGGFYEGTGLNGRSGIRKVKLETGEVLQSKPLGPQYFGEGITDWKGSLVQITWQSEIGFVYDMKSFEQTRTWSYSGEGWGLTHDGTNLIMSDGTSELRVLDPVTFVEKRRIKVTAAGTPLRDLNEVEFVKGEIFANIWMTDYIARIAADSGKVTGYIDLRGLLTSAERARTDVLNGVAYDAKGDRLFVTGKWWPKLFEIKLVKKSG